MIYLIRLGDVRWACPSRLLKFRPFMYHAYVFHFSSQMNFEQNIPSPINLLKLRCVTMCKKTVFYILQTPIR
jgi:hypothetical protein